MTVKPNVAPVRSTGYVIVAADWGNDIQQSQNYFLELLGGTNSDKIPSAALDPAGTPTFGIITLTNGGANQVSLQSSGFGTVALRNVSGVLTIYSSGGGNITLDATNKLNASSAAFSGAVTMASTLVATGTISGASPLTIGTARIFSGSGAPSMAANPGDMYLNTSGGLWMRQSGGAWNQIAGS